jgi:acyl-homoserine lactone acylase PvdQ
MKERVAEAERLEATKRDEWAIRQSELIQLNVFQQQYASMEAELVRLKNENKDVREQMEQARKSRAGTSVAAAS